MESFLDFLELPCHKIVFTVHVGPTFPYKGFHVSHKQLKKIQKETLLYPYLVTKHSFKYRLISIYNGNIVLSFEVLDTISAL